MKIHQKCNFFDKIDSTLKSILFLNTKVTRCCNFL